MPDPRETLLAVSDFVTENSHTGIGGWGTGAVPSRNASGNKLFIALRDTDGLNVKDVTADTWTSVFTATNSPAGIVSAEDGRASVYAADWAGQSNTNMWIVTDSKVLYGSIAGGFSDKTPSGGIATAPGKGGYRQVMLKCASDPVQGGVFAACFAGGGWKKTLDGGNSWSAIGTMPAPSAQPAAWGNMDASFGQIVPDTSSSRTGAAPADRYSKWALSSEGQGVYLSTDGLNSVTKITPSGSLTTTVWMGFYAGTLYAIFGDDAYWANSATRNLYKYSGTGTTWTQLGNSAEPVSYFSAVFSVRAAGDMVLNHTSGEMTYTADPATPTAYKTFRGAADAGLFVQTKTKKRPFIAQTYHNNGGVGAPGPLSIVDTYLYVAMGYGYLRTPLASFPTAGALYTPNYSTAWPTWEEDAEGYEAIVGQSCVFTSNGLVCLAQDVGTVIFHDNTSGHDATYAEFPGSSLTNGIGCSVGVSDRNFAVTGALKSGPHFGYSTNGRSFTKMANQPPSSIGTGDTAPGGAVVAGPNALSGWCQYFPTYNSPPLYTDDLGATAWKTLTFYRTATGTSSPIDTSYTYNGFDGAIPYYENHWPCVADPNNPGVYYALNIGGALATDGSPGSTWTSDPAGNAGLYKMDVNVEPGVYRRVKAGRLITWGNGGQYTLYMGITSDGHLIIMPNSLSGTGAGNYTLDVNLADLSVRQITSVVNLKGFAIGPSLVPGGPQGIWAAGYLGSTYGLWLSFDRFQTAPWGGKNFNFRTALGGYIKCLAAHPTTFGLLAAALPGGHARFRLQF